MNLDDAERLHKTSLKILDEIGVRLEHDQIVERVLKAGARSGLGVHVVRFPPEMVEEYLAGTPSSLTLTDRTGDQPKVLRSTSPSVFWTNPGLRILDVNGIRDVTSSDLGRIARLCDHLQNVQGVMGMAMADILPLHRDFVGIRIIAENCRKHVRALCFSPKGMEALAEMKQVFPGNWISMGFTAHGPLRWTHLALDIFLKSAGFGIPTTINGEPMAGVTGPVSIAGSAAVGNAEILSGIVVNQILEPGRPVIYNLGLAHTFDMKYASAVTGGPENALFALASAVMGRFYDLPSSSWVSTDSLCDDSQASLEKMFGFQTHTSSRVSLIWGVGQLESEKTISLSQLVLDNEMIDYVKRFQRSFDVTEDSLQYDQIQKVGIGGSYLETDYTLHHFKDHLWMPRILNRAPRSGETNTIEQRAQSVAEHVLESDRDPKLSSEEALELRSIEDKFRESIKA